MPSQLWEEDIVLFCILKSERLDEAAVHSPACKGSAFGGTWEDQNSIVFHSLFTYTSRMQKSMVML